MLSPQEFAAAWGEDRYRFPPDILGGIDIPEAAKAFLVEAGLPLRAEVQEDLFAVPLPPALSSATSEVNKLPLLSRYQSSPFRLLAFVLDEDRSNHWLGAESCGYGVYYAVEESTGCLYRVGPGAEAEATRFVNSSLAQFAEFLLCYRDFLTRLRLDQSPDHTQYEVLFASLKQKWRRMDPEALTDPDNYWVMCLYYQF